MQFIIVIFLGIKIKNQQKQVLGLSVNPIPKNSLLFPKNKTFKYFYEPKPNSTTTVEGEFVTELGYPVGTIIKNDINADGLNQMANYTQGKPKGVYRIITIGDSFTYGLNVNTQDNYPSQLENILNQNLKCKNINKFQVMNLGVSGYDISYAIKRYKLRGQKYDPDLVLWFIIGPDLTRIDELQIPKSDYYSNLLNRSGENDQLMKKGIFYQGWNIALTDIIKTFAGADNIFKIEKKYFLEFNDYYKGPLLIFNFSPSVKYLAENNSVLNDFKNSRKNTLLYDRLINIFTNSENYLKDGHPSTQGYTIIADDLYNYLTKNNIIPCQKP